MLARNSYEFLPEGLLSASARLFLSVTSLFALGTPMRVVPCRPVPLLPLLSAIRLASPPLLVQEEGSEYLLEPPRSLSYFDAWPTGVNYPEANPEVGGRRGLRSIQWLRGLREDVGRKAPLYFSDWRDGLTRKSLAAISFLFFACFAPVIAFGGAMGALTGGAMGVSEVLVSCGLSGMAYAALAGQPMTFVGPTGLTLAFTAALYQWCTFMSLPFLPMYAWVGCWTSLMLVVASMANASGLIRYCTRFTEDVFNALLAFNFLSEALRSLATEFVDASRGFLAFDTALITAWLCQTTAAFRNKRYLSAGAREAVSDFGPAAVIVGVTAVSLLPAVQRLGDFARLSMPSTFGLSGGRELFVNMLALPAHFRWFAAFPAVFLAVLFFLDQNITVRTVNSPSNNLKKGAAYHLDLATLGLLTGGASVVGLPWMCSATVQSLNHVRAMSLGSDGTEVVETRVTGFGVHAAILASALILPSFSAVPLPVISGVFLYLGQKVMKGNQFLQRCKTVWLDEDRLNIDCQDERQMVVLGRGAVARFTAIQALCLAALWALKLNPATALIFPSVIGVLMVLRAKVLPKIFTTQELRLLDTRIGATKA